MTQRELQLLAARERVTLRPRVRGSRHYWDICARTNGGFELKVYASLIALACTNAF
jgi:hypothetical protein